MNIIKFLCKSLYITGSITLICSPAWGADYYTMEPVVVTAQKLEENPQKVPVSLSVMQEDEIDNSGSIHLSDIGNYVPNLNFTHHLAMHDLITIRGIGGYSRNIGFDTRVGVYLDGVYVGQSPALNLDLVDMERVEVMRGPQGAFWGQNTVAGAINLISPKPHETFESKAAVGIGSSKHRQARFFVNAPLVEEKLYSSFSFSHFEREGLYTNLSTGEDLNDLDSQAFRSQFLALLSQQAEFRFNLDASSVERSAFLGDPLTDSFASSTDTVAPGDYDVSFNTKPFEDTDIYGLSGTLDYHLNNDFKLTSITAFRHSKCFYQNDVDYSIFDFLNIEYVDDYKQLSQEIRLNSQQDNAFNYTGGLYYFRQNGTTDRAATFGSSIPALGDPALLPGNIVRNTGDVITNSYAFFVNGGYQLSPKNNISAGFRYTYEQKKSDFHLDGSHSGSFNIAVLDYSDKSSDATLSPSLGLTHTFNDQNTGYAKITTGHKSAGVNLDFLSNNDVAAGIKYDKETVINYETGLKSKLFDNRLGINLSAFYAKYDDYQVNQFVDLGGGATSISIKNAAKVVSKGAEFELLWYPNSEWQINSNLSYLDAYFDTFPGGGTAGADASGNDLPFAPHFTSNINLQYSVPVDLSGAQLTLHGNYFHTAKQYTSPSNTETQALSGGGTVPFGVLESYDLFSVKAGLTPGDDTWAVNVWIKNITDEEYLTDSFRDFLGTILASRGLPRTYGIDFNYRF